MQRTLNTTIGKLDGINAASRSDEDLGGASMRFEKFSIIEVFLAIRHTSAVRVRVNELHLLFWLIWDRIHRRIKELPILRGQYYHVKFILESIHYFCLLTKMLLLHETH